MVPGGDILPLNQVGKVELLRLKAALRLWKSNKYDLILTTGGLYLPRSIQTLPSAEVSKKWLISQGVSGDCIVALTNSADSFQEVASVVTWAKENRKKLKITIVTHWQHALRFFISFLSYRFWIKRYSLYYCVPIKDWLMEWVFILIHLTDPRGWGILPRWNRKQRRQSTAPPL